MPTPNEHAWGHVRLKPALWKKLKDLAEKERRTLTAVLERAVEQYKSKE